MKHEISGKNKSDLTIAFILVFTLGLAIGHYQLIGFFASLFEDKDKSEVSALTKENQPIVISKMTTYFQWFDHKGKMRISQFQPKNSVDFITFEGSHDLRDVSYDVDKETLRRGLAYRNKLLTGGNSQNETDHFLGNLLAKQNTTLLDQDEQCGGLTGWLTDISRTIAQDESMRRAFCEKYKTRLQELQQMGCRSTLESFENLVCS